MGIWSNRRKVTAIFSLSLIIGPVLAGELTPPQQDYYLHFSQHPNFCCGDDALALGSHDHVFLWDELPEMARREDWSWTDELTIEAWVLWEDSDLEEIKSVTAIDIDRMTLICGSAAYGFRYRGDESDGWTFFLQTTEQIHPDTGTIPLPKGEWAHLAATYDGSAIRTFLNGVLQTETPASGGVMWLTDGLGNAEFLDACRWHQYDQGVLQTPVHHLAIGVGTGFTGGIRQLRLWNRSLSSGEVLSNSSVHLSGSEAGLIGYWPMNDPFADVPPTALGSERYEGKRYFVISNKANLDYPLYLRHNSLVKGASWRLTEPTFEVREDLAEDIVVTDCQSLPWGNLYASGFIDVQNDNDLDLIIAGADDFPCAGDHKQSIAALVRDDANGFVFNSDAAIAGPKPFNRNPLRPVQGDFNGDNKTDVFFPNTGEDFCIPVGGSELDAGAPNTLLLSRPDGRLEDASDNLLAPPCTLEEALFEGQHACYAGGDFGGRTPGFRFPAAADPIPLSATRDFSHGAAAGDIDGDGDLDIVLANHAQVGMTTPYVLINDGAGNFVADWQKMPEVLFGDKHLNPGQYRLDIKVTPPNFLLEDMDGDGHVDLIAAPDDWVHGSGDWVLGIFWNEGDGDYSNSDVMVIEPTEGVGGTPERPPNSSGGMAITDIDNDGDKDLLISWDSADWGLEPQSLQIMVNQGNRVFADETIVRIGPPPQKDMSRLFEMIMHVQDVNADGCVDIVFTEDIHIRPMGAGIWLNDCYGYFTPRYDSTFTKQDGVFFPFDYEGDGDIDFLHGLIKPLNLASSVGCDENEGDGSDYIDFSVILNVKPLKGPLIFRDGYESKK